ncbi:MAG: hypothetical protein HY901_12750 [Deltaproteobacteria bacterium]|nr:hypothetical protein [Deltaproteobacteria bacterium]
MFGEAHGSKELGNLSADLFEHLVRSGLVDTLALEYVMDANPSIDTYLETGVGPLVSVYHFDRMSPNDFARLLLERARRLRKEGFAIRAFAVDYPWDLHGLNERITAIAERLSAEQKALALGTMPAAPPGLSPNVDADFVASAEAYDQHIAENRATICSALDEPMCEELMMLARALWIGAFAASGAVSYSTNEQFAHFVGAREDLIYYNFRAHLTSGHERVYAHMGLAHTMKGDPAFGFDAVAGRLDKQFPPTLGRVFSTRQDCGPGSKVLYGGSIEKEATEFEDIASALAHEPLATHVVPTNDPSAMCVANPVADLPISSCSERCGDVYDAIVFLRLLTPDDGLALRSTSADLRRALHQLDKVRAAEAKLLQPRH